MTYESQGIKQHSLHPTGWALPLDQLGLGSLRICRGENILCGDHIDLYYDALSFNTNSTKPANVVAAPVKVAFAGQSCALCRASASILMSCLQDFAGARQSAASLVNYIIRTMDSALPSTVEDRQIPQVLASNLSPQRLRDLGELLGLTQYRTRLGCLLLPWKTYQKLLGQLNYSEKLPKPLPISSNILQGTSGRPFVTRIAPSPTGHLHLGHVLHLTYVWGISRVLGAKRILRIEDHDQSRCRPAYKASILADLEWLGLVPRDETIMVPYQSQRLSRYQVVLEQLQDRGLLYACVCSRKTIVNRMPQGTHSGFPAEVEICYQGTCRSLQLPLNSPNACLRLKWPEEDVVSFCDLRHGAMVQFPSKQCGDMVLRDRLGQYTYQFAVVVDDWDKGVNLIIRGDDLLESVGRQLLLRRILGDLAEIVTYHHPLLYDAQQQKLSKRLKAASLETLKAAGLSAEDVFGQALFASGSLDHPRPITLANIEQLFRNKGPGYGP